MGLYYNPNPPHVGAQQPLDSKKLVPPQSGPTPQNPPFPGARIGQAVLVCWMAAVVTAAIAPIIVKNLNPPISGPVAQNPPLIGARVPLPVIQTAWLPPAPAPIVARNLKPPISGPAPQNPPIIGANIPLPVQVAWIPPPPAAVVAINLNPPIGGPAPQNPPIIGTSVPLAVQVAWIPPAPAPILAINLKSPISGPVANAPPIIGARIPLPVQISWIPPPPAPIVAIHLDPPIGVSTPDNPPIIGAAVSTAVLVGWLPPAPAPIVVVNLKPPVTGPAVNNPPIASKKFVQWPTDAPLPYDLLVRRQGIPTAPAVSNVPVGAQVPQAILSAWASQPVTPIRPVTVTLSGPQNPPFIGSRIPVEVQVSWILPAPSPIVARNLDPPIAGPDNPPVRSVRQLPWPDQTFLPYELVNRRSVPSQAVSYLPAGSAVSQEILSAWWADADHLPQRRDLPAALVPFDFNRSLVCVTINLYAAVGCTIEASAAVNGAPEVSAASIATVAVQSGVGGKPELKDC